MPNYSEKFKKLASEYTNITIEFPELKDVTLAQWILESGRGASDLASKFNNFGGLKWRSEMAGFATPVHYDAHDGPDVYCAFETERDFILGYWRFLDRPPYKGWRDEVENDESFISFIGKIYAPVATSYAEKILNLRAEARQLLGTQDEPGDGVIDDSHGTSESFTKPHTTFIDTKNFNSRNGVKIARVILHYTAQLKLQSVINTFKSQTEKKSCHYIIDKNGDIYQMVNDNHVAWHCKGANSDSIGIEHIAVNGEALTSAQEAATIALIKYLLGTYKLKSGAVTGHNFAKGRQTVTACPHSLFGKYVEGDVSGNEKKLKDWVKKNFPEFA